MFGKSRGLFLTILFISLVSYLGYRNEKKIDQVLSKIDTEKKLSIESRNEISTHKLENESESIEKHATEQKDPNQPILTPSQVEEIVKSYILQNPQIIADGLDKLQHLKTEEIKKQIQESIANHKSDLDGSNNSLILGNKSGKSIVVMFFDYNCGYCKQSADAIENFIAANQEAKLILKVYPILGSESEFLARIAIAVNIHTPNKFHEIHNELLSNKLFDKDDILELLKKHKVNYQEVVKISESEEVTNQIQMNIKLAKALQLNGVPAFIINGNYYPGFLSAEQLIEKSKIFDQEDNQNSQIKEDKKIENRE